MNNVKALLCVCFIFSFQLIFAQGIGIKAGVLYNNLELKISVPNYVSIDPEQLVGFTFGAMYQKQFNQVFSMKTELGYSRKGAKFPDPLMNTLFKSKLNYLDFAALGKFNLYKDVSIECGAEAAYLMNDEIIFREDIDLTFDLGLVGGVAYLFNEKIEFTARYYYGLRPVFNFVFTDQMGSNVGSYEYFNRNLEVSIGYFLSGNKNSNS